MNKKFIPHRINNTQGQPQPMFPAEPTSKNNHYAMNFQGSGGLIPPLNTPAQFQLIQHQIVRPNSLPVLDERGAFVEPLQQPQIDLQLQKYFEMMSKERIPQNSHPDPSPDFSFTSQGQLGTIGDPKPEEDAEKVVQRARRKAEEMNEDKEGENDWEDLKEEEEEEEEEEKREEKPFKGITTERRLKRIKKSLGPFTVAQRIAPESVMFWFRSEAARRAALCNLTHQDLISLYWLVQARQPPDLPESYSPSPNGRDSWYGLLIFNTQNHFLESFITYLEDDPLIGSRKDFPYQELIYTYETRCFAEVALRITKNTEGNLERIGSLIHRDIYLGNSVPRYKDPLREKKSGWLINYISGFFNTLVFNGFSQDWILNAILKHLKEGTLKENLKYCILNTRSDYFKYFLEKDGLWEVPKPRIDPNSFFRQELDKLLTGIAHRELEKVDLIPQNRLIQAFPFYDPDTKGEVIRDNIIIKPSKQQKEGSN